MTTLKQHKVQSTSLHLLTPPSSRPFSLHSSSAIVSFSNRSPTSGRCASAAVTAWTPTTRSVSSACGARAATASRSSCQSYTAANAPAAKVGSDECGPSGFAWRLSRQCVKRSIYIYVKVFGRDPRLHTWGSQEPRRGKSENLI